MKHSVQYQYIGLVTIALHPSIVLQSLSQASSEEYLTCFKTVPCVRKFSLKQSVSLGSKVGSMMIGSVGGDVFALVSGVDSVVGVVSPQPCDVVSSVVGVGSGSVVSSEVTAMGSVVSFSVVVGSVVSFSVVVGSVVSFFVVVGSPLVVVVSVVGSGTFVKMPL